MLLPTIEGVIRRRILVNFRVDAAVAQKVLPGAFRPKLINGSAMAGICLIRLEQVRPRGLPSFIGMSSENAAHRVAVQWMDAGGEAREGVYIPRRDSGSFVNRFLGGRLFPGEHNAATFQVDDNGKEVDLVMSSDDGRVRVELHGMQGDVLPATSCFSSLEQASEFFRGGALGYSETRQRKRLDGVTLRTRTWSMSPLTVVRVESSFFADVSSFPAGSVEFDCALVMRDIRHEWHGAAQLARDVAIPGARHAA